MNKRTASVKRMLSLIVVLAMILTLIPVSVFAATEKTLYLKPNSNWTQENARFAAYFFGNGETWVSMTDSDGDGVYEVAVPTNKTYPSVIFVRMNPSTTANNWNNKWNQTGDLTVPTNTNNLYTVKEGTWDKGGGTWSVYTPPTTPVEHTYTVAGDSAPLFGAEWNTTNTANDMTKQDDGTYVKVYEDVAAGTYKYKVVRDHSWDHAWGGDADADGNAAFTVVTDGSTVTITFDGAKVEATVEAPEVEPEEPSEEPGEPAETVEYEATFHFANTLNWGIVNLYTWTDAGTHSGAWPGSAVSQDAKGFYSVTVKYEGPAGEGLNYIFNNGSTQTADLTLGADAFDDDHKAEVWVKLTSADAEGKYGATTYTTGDAIAISPVVNDTSVTFQYDAPSATSVEVRGTMSSWDTGVAMTKNAYGIWSVTIENVTPGIHEYKFVADGNWTADPLNTWTIGENSAFLISDPSKDANEVTVIVHYNRTDGNYENWNLYMWNENGSKQYDFTAGEGEVTTTITVDGRGTQSVNFKVRKSVGSNKWAAEEGQVTVDLSTIVSGTIHIYTGGKYTGNQTMENDVVFANKISDVQYDYEANTVTIYTNKAAQNPETAFGLVKEDAAAGWTYDAAASTGGKYVFKLTDTPTLSALYRYTVRFYEQAEAFHTVNYGIGIDSVYASDKFAEEFTYNGKDLGATYSSSATTFRLWAPTAEEVSVALYSTGSDDEVGAAALGSYAMTKDEKGTWVATIDGDLKNVYYTYSVKVNGKTVEANDPYSVTTGVNGLRSMVTDLDATDPTGWANDKNPNPVTSQTDAVIYELHVRDFSIDDSSGISEANRGKFLAFTEEGTTVSGKGQISTGIDYLADLGITHLHLLPIYDYASVDEDDLDTPQFNWGYDPQNYNVPEGSYSTNPYDGNVRVNEMKQMVMALHDHGISVVMDVVYNHVYDASTFSYNQIVPGYFSRVDSNRSGCGNDTASEREMVRKYIVESVLYWHQEYHIDGFRFDLVGLLDVETINQIVTEVHACCPDVIFYGEGWDMDDTNKEPGTEMAKQGNASKTPGFAYFSDSMRNNLGGNNGNSTGFASGAGNGGSMVNEWLAKPWWTTNPEQVIQYASCHDNYTLADKIIISTKRSEIDATVQKMSNLAGAFYLTAQGVPFIHAGEEFYREKLTESGGRSENSYNASDYVNHIEWSDLENSAYAASVAYYQGLIAFRQAHPALRYSTAALVKDNVQTLSASGNLIVMRIDGNGAEAETSDILLIFNAASSSATVNLPQGEWTINVKGNKAGTASLGTATGSVSVEGISAMILTKADEGKDEKEPLGATEEKTIYFSNNKGWSEVYAYAWTDGGATYLLGGWPGSAMTYVETNDYGEKIYSVTLPASETGIEGVIFHNNAGAQTVDIQPGADGTGYYCTEADAEGKFNVGTYTYRAPVLGTADDYFLGGWINNADYTGSDYAFENGTLTTTFSADSYVYVVNGVGTTYMTDGYQGAVSSATLKDTAKHTLTGDKWDKLLIPGGDEVIITLVVNDDNTVTLSYESTTTAAVDNSGVQKGVTLHCWNWSFENITANMATIASQGYTAIQTSPVQPLKEASNLPEHSVKGNWWVYYQPVDFVITTDEGNALGTKTEFEEMCAEAEKYGIQVIVDVVANHLGNEEGNDQAIEIPDALLVEDYWHDITTDTTDYTNRYDITQHCMGGLPDLNTANKALQNIILDYLKELVDAGADGFRFDAAKHIETPKDDATFASDFWPTVVDGIQAYAGNDLYIYGEVLDDPAIAISAYTQYMSVTDNGWSNHMRNQIAAGTANLVAGYYKSAPATNLVLWAESHDTYMTNDANQSSYGVSEADIIKTWALVAARKDAMGLYFARPESIEQAIGVASVTGWATDAVKYVNEFHNAFDGQDEVVSNENGISYVERGTAGAILVNVGSNSANVNVSAKAMADGEYFDRLTGNTFTVANGRISGTIGTTDIAVLVRKIPLMSMKLENSLEVMFAFPKAWVSGEGYKVVISQEGKKDQVITQENWGSANANGTDSYTVTYTGLAAKEMVDALNVVVYDANGDIIATTSRSVVDYAISAYNKASAKGNHTAEEAKALYVDLLTYGAAAQTKFGYKTDDLATDYLTDEMKEFQHKNDIDLSTKKPADGDAKLASCVLESNISLRMAFDAKYLTGYTFTYSFVDHNEKTVSGELVPVETVINNVTYAMVTIDKLVVADCGRTVTVTITDASGTENVAGSDSVGNWATRTKDTELAMAMMQFSESARAYLH